MEHALELAVAAIGELPADRRQFVAIDGIDGAGKTTFADMLAGRLERPAVRASEDGFHNPRHIRYRRGRRSPAGFFLDSFDLDALTRHLLRPFSAGETFCTRAFDYRADRPVERVEENAPSDAVLVIDGLFLHRPELRGWWDVSIWLDVPPTIAATRFQTREGRLPDRRYVEGQELYIASTHPQHHASLVVSFALPV